jgi:hypothetical protein
MTAPISTASSLCPPRSRIAACRSPGVRRSREDCKTLGLRERRNHDARRTMISRARADGASKDLKIERNEGRVIELRKAAAAGCTRESAAGGSRAQVLGTGAAKCSDESGNGVGRTGFGPVTCTV